jgi:hypothetical protein
VPITAAVAALVALVSFVAVNAAENALQFRTGLTAAQLSSAAVVQMPRGVHRADIALLRDDQMLETPSGKRISVKRYRALTAAFAKARLDTAHKRPAGFAFLAPPQGPGKPLLPHETAQHLLARPPTDVVQLPDGKTATIAQMRVEAPWVERHYHVAIAPAPVLTGPATLVKTSSTLQSIPRNAPDSTILTSPNGTRITLGQLRSYLKSQVSATTVKPNAGTR